MSIRASHESVSFINQSNKQKQLFLLVTDIVFANLKNWEQVSSLTTDIVKMHSQ